MIRLGVVGYGQRIDGVINHCIKKSGPEHLREEIRVVGVVDPGGEKVRARLAPEDREASFYADLATLVREAKPDGLLIGTRCNLHTPYAIEAAAFGLPLYLEKPVSVNLQQALALEKAYVGRDLPVVVSFPLRVSPLCLQAEALIRGGALGRPDHVMAQNYVSYGAVYYEQAYRDYAQTQGLFLQKATHDFDYIAMLMGAPIVRVAAMANLGRIYGGDMPAGLRCKDCPQQETCVESPQNRARRGEGAHDHACLFGADMGTPETGMNEDCSSALLQFASGAHGVYSQVFYSRRDSSARGAKVAGYSGSLDMDWYRNDIKLVKHHEPFSTTYKAGDGLSHFGGDAALAEEYLQLVRGEKRVSRTPIETGLASVYACLAAKESVKTGSFEWVRQVGQVS